MKGTAPNRELLAIFIAVADEKSFSRAARRLRIGKATVSRAIARLERALDAELLHRTTHDVALSTAGAALYERTAHLLAALDAAVLDLPERAAEPSGTLRLTAPYDFGTIALPEIVAQFARRYARVRFDVHLTNAVVDLVADGFDVAIRAAPRGRLKDSTLTARRLGDVMGADLYASLPYLARRGRPKHVGDPKHDWILPPVALSILRLRREDVRFLADDNLHARELVRAGAGIGWLPRFLAVPYVSEGLLEAIPLPDLPTMRASFVLLYPSSGQVPRKVAAFRDVLVDRFTERPIE